MKTICIAGRLGKAAELRRTQNGDPVLSFSVAVDDGLGDNKRTLWFRCSMWGKRGETLKDMLPKGKEVTVSGDLSSEEYEGKTNLTIRVNDLTLQGGVPSERSDPRQDRVKPDRDDARTGGGYSRDLDDADDLPF